MEKPKHYGQCVYILRNRLGFTQKQFADMLGCDQAMISKIESGTILYGEVVHQTAWKLGFHVGEFNGASGNELEDFYYNQQIRKEVRDYIDRRKYKELGLYLKKCWKKPQLQNEKGRVFLYWNQGIVELHVKNDPTSALEHFEEALRRASRFETFINQIEIINSYAIVSFVTGDWEAAIHHLNQAKEWLSILNQTGYPHIRTRVLYNLANAHLRLRQYEQAREIALQAIQICKRNKSTYLRGAAMYLYGYSCYRLGLKEEAKKSFEKSVFYLLDNDEEEWAKRAIRMLSKLEL